MPPSPALQVMALVSPHTSEIKQYEITEPGLVGLKWPRVIPGISEHCLGASPPNIVKIPCTELVFFFIPIAFS